MNIYDESRMTKNMGPRGPDQIPGKGNFQNNFPIRPIQRKYFGIHHKKVIANKGTGASPVANF